MALIVGKRMRLYHLLLKSRVSVAFLLGLPIGVTVLHLLGVPDLPLPIALPALLGTLLSILLGFRTNSAYARWWEARKIWGAIVNDSRSWTRQVLSFLGVGGEGRSSPEEIAALEKELVYRQMAWNYALSRTLRRQEPWDDLAPFLSAHEIDDLRAQDNVPNALLQTQGDRLRKARARGDIDGFAFLNLDEMLTRLCDSMGKCERIKNTVFPTPYAYLVTLVAIGFYILLPFGLIAYLGWITIPATFLVGGIFFSIEALSTSLQDPFENRDSDTPTTALSRTIEINLRQQLGETDLPGKIAPEGGVLM